MFEMFLLNKPMEKSFENLERELIACFADPIDVPKARLSFYSRNRFKGEPVIKYLTELFFLGENAFPNIPVHQLDQLVSEMFVNNTNDYALKSNLKKLYASECRTTRELLEAAKVHVLDYEDEIRAY